MERKYKIALVFIWLLIGFLLIKLGDFPKHATIVKEVVPTVVLKVVQKYSNDYFSFCYSDDYIARSEGNNLWLTGKVRAMESVVTTSRNFKEAIDEETGVKMRRAKKTDYLEKKIKVAGVEALLFEKKDWSEKSIFILRKNIMTTFSMMANFQDDKMGNKLWQMLECFEWK